MEFKVFLLCFAVLFAATSAAIVCKCEEKKDTEYKLKIKDGDKEINEEIKVDTEKQTETVTVPKTDIGNAGEVKVVYDFEKNLTMQRLSAAKACFLSESTGKMPKPEALINLLDQQTGTVTAYNGTEEEYDAVSTVIDRSFLGDEMASMCAKLPIYRVKKSTIRRVKRWSCPRYCYRYCHWQGCCHSRCVRPHTCHHSSSGSTGGFPIPL